MKKLISNSHLEERSLRQENKTVMPILPKGKIQGIFELNKRIGRSLEFFADAKNRDDISLFTRVACFWRLPRLKLAMTTLALTTILSATITIESRAENTTPTIIESGSCGTNCIYTIDSDNNFVATALQSGDEGYVAGSIAVVSEQFQNKNLTSVTLSEGISKVGIDAFRDNAISSLNIPSSLYYVDQHAFRNNNLTELNIPSTLTILGWGAFGENDITTATVPDHFTVIPPAFLGSNPLTSVEIPNTVTKIDHWAFGYCGLTDITIPDSVTSIGSAAFFGNDLQEVVLSDSLESIGENAFLNNHNLTKIVIPDTIKEIGKNAFGNISLENLQIVCKGSSETCVNLKNLLSNYKDENDNIINLSGNLKIAGETMCDSTNYYWDGSKCIRQPDVTKRKCCANCRDMGGFCNRIRWTPAEVAKVLRDDDTNVVTITFKK